MQRPTTLLCSVASVLLFCSACRDRSSNNDMAELVLRGGVIYTADDQRARAESLAIRGGEIIAVGEDRQVAALIGRETQVIDLAGRFALPGFHDAHIHLLSSGHSMLGCPVHSAESAEHLVEMLVECAKKEPEGWLVGSDFDLGLFPGGNPHKGILDQVFPDRPVLVRASDGHSSWVNSQGLRLAQITAETADPEQGVIERSSTGEPTGTLRETAQDLIEAMIPPATLEQDVLAVRASLAEIHRHGITSVIEAAAGEADLEALTLLDRQGELNARVVVSVEFDPLSAERETFERSMTDLQQYRSERLRVGAVKLFLDGVLEGETAALLEPYVAMGDHRGELNFEPEDLAELVTRMDANGHQLHMHAIGDRAVRAGLDAVESARARNGRLDNRHHIAHLQLISEADLPRFSSLEVAANFQSLWAYPDTWIMDINLPVVGQDRVDRMYPIGSVHRAGGLLVGGSDWSVSSVNPLLAIETAVRRADATTEGGKVLNPAERVDLATMIDATTRNGAWLMHQEHQTGSLEVGKRADVVVLERDLFEIPVEDIGEVAVVMTIFDGEIVYRAD